MKPRFRVGDVVRIAKSLVYTDEYTAHIGKVGTITRATADTCYQVDITDDLTWFGAELDPVYPPEYDLSNAGALI